MFSTALKLFRKTTAAPQYRQLFLQVHLPQTGLLHLTLAPGKQRKYPHRLWYVTQKRLLASQKGGSKRAVLGTKGQKMETFWDVCPNDNSDVVGAELVTVMSYNILAQHLCNTHPMLYERHVRRHLAWDHRMNCIIRRIESVQPTVLCLQEVQQDHLPEISKRLFRLGLDQHIYKKRTNEDYQDGCAIFYRSEVLELCDSHLVEYFQPNVVLLDRPNVAILAKFRSTVDPNIVFCAATTHLLYNPKREDVRLAQVQILLAEIDRFSYIGKQSGTGKLVYAPVILTGDFNAQPCTAPIELIATGQCCYHELAGKNLRYKEFMDSPTYGKQLLPTSVGITDSCQHINFAKYNSTNSTYLYNSSDPNCTQEVSADEYDLSEMPFQTGTLRHNLHLGSVYRNENTATTFHDEWITVDYIFYSHRYDSAHNLLVEDSLRLVERSSLPTVDFCYRMGPIPNETEGSDHLMQAAKFLVLPMTVQTDN